MNAFKLKGWLKYETKKRLKNETKKMKQKITTNYEKHLNLKLKLKDRNKNMTEQTMYRRTFLCGSETTSHADLVWRRKTIGIWSYQTQFQIKDLCVLSMDLASLAGLGRSLKSNQIGIFMQLATKKITCHNKITELNLIFK